MNIEKILTILESNIGSAKRLRNGEYSYYCPVCHHHKRKLVINLDPNSNSFGSWHCWICQETHNTKGRKVTTLLKKINASDSDIKNMYNAIGSTSYTIQNNTLQEKNIIVSLPNEFVSLLDKRDTIDKRHAMVELKRRGINEIDIKRYNIGYCENGEYKHRLIIPSYDDNGILNYFVARSYFKNEKIKYKNPSFSKDIIMFDLYINWNYPVTIVEGVFDAIAVRRNAIPILGKSLSNNLIKKIIDKKPPVVNICLDKDAYSDALKISEKLYNMGVNVKIIDLNDKDPSDIGFEEMVKLIENNNHKMNDSNIFESKLVDMLNGV